MATYKIALEGDILRVGFGDPAQNDQIVRDAVARLEAMVADSLPVAMAISHAIAHLYEVVACFDPKLAKYVVAVSHGADHKVGDLID